jgi:phosphoserine phosphatase
VQSFLSSLAIIRVFSCEVLVAVIVYAFDVDGVLTPVRSSWHFVKRVLGVGSRFDGYAHLFFSGFITYDEWVYLELRLVKGTSLEVFKKILSSIPWRCGIEELVEFKRSRPGDLFIAVTGGMLCERVVKELGFDACIGVEVEAVDGRLTGFAKSYTDFHSKGMALTDFLYEKGIKPSKVICIGDSINDLGMFKYCDISIAFCPSNMIKKSHTHIYIPSCSIKKLIEVLKQL